MCSTETHHHMMRTKKHKKIMPQGNRKNKRKRRTKGTKVQGRRKEHLSVLGETTTAQYESACFLDAARPRIKNMAAEQQQNERKETDLTAPARLRDVQRYETYTCMVRHRKFEMLLSPRPTIYAHNSREIPASRDKVSSHTWKNDAIMFFNSNDKKKLHGWSRNLGGKTKFITSVQQTFSHPRGVSLPHRWEQNKASHWNQPEFRYKKSNAEKSANGN